MINPSQRMRKLDTQFFAELNERIIRLKSRGADVIRLDVGSPDMPPAPHIVAALSNSASKPDTHGYQSHKGIRPLRQAWADMYRRLYQVDLDPEREILLLMGSKEGIYNMIMAFADPGDAVLLPDPGYLTYMTATLFAGAEPYILPLLAENDYLPDLKSIPANVARQAKLLWLNYPNNPTAAVAPFEFFVEAVEFARRFSLLVCHDAAYAQVVFDGYHAPSLLQVPGAKEVSVEFNTLSKSHNMAGWRVGVAVGNTKALHVLYSVKTYADSGHFLPILEASAVALTGDQSWLDGRNSVYQKRRDLMVKSLVAMGLQPALPKASLYVWCPLPQGWTSMGFVETLLEEAHVSLTPGTVFGQYGEGYVRISVTAPENRIADAMQRMERWMRR